MDASRFCVVVANARSARILFSECGCGGCVGLVEHAVLGSDAYARSPEGPGRRVDSDRRFAIEIAGQVAAAVKDGRCGSVVLTAAPAMLGLLRQLVQESVPRGVAVTALAKDYITLTAKELAQRLALH